ncbi:hypothetical protein [Myceligenerans crystallogenes]|uniref:Uncharacterized protein n=1 Tax=Myceligenerans crystallogenes TaxID=316335 RepID=A0ABN2NLW7_9MICO
MTDRFMSLRRQYLSLGLGELVSVVLFALVAVVSVAPRLPESGQRALWWALAPLLVVLVQAGVYWLAARSWIGRTRMPAGFAAVYRVFPVLNPLLLAVALLGVVTSWPDQAPAGVLVAGVWLFGVAEHLNYFVVRLSYPLMGWFANVRRRRTPVLVRDLRRAAVRVEPGSRWMPPRGWSR